MEPYNFTLDTIKVAGEILLSYYEKGVKAQFKGGNPRDIVTEADYAINDFLIGKIRSQFPDHLIYSEEGVSNKQTEMTEKPTWMLDPIDGTSNFSRQIPHFSISMGLVQNGEVQSGAVYNPVTGELYHFKKGGGVYRNNVQVQVSTITKLDRSFVLMRAGRKKDLWQWGSDLYLKLLQNANKTSSFGSSALDICFVASGKVEAVIYGNISISVRSTGNGVNVSTILGR